MSGANPVDAKAGANPAAALNPPAGGPAPAGTGLWAKLTRHKAVGLAVGGAALVLGGGWYGFTHFSPAPPRVVAQSEPAPAPDATPLPIKAEESLRRPETIADRPPDVPIPAVPVVSSDRPPDLKTGTTGFAVRPPDGTAKPPRPTEEAPLLIEAPPSPGEKPTVKPAEVIELPAVVAPPDGEQKKPADATKKPGAGDQFKATDKLTDPDKKKSDDAGTGPAPRPTEDADKLEVELKPVIPTGGTAEPPPIPGAPKDTDTVGPKPETKKEEPPSIPKIDPTIPGPPPEPKPDTKTEVPSLVIPPNTGDKPPAKDKKDEVPTLVIPKTKPRPAEPETKKEEPPSIPKIDLTAPDAVKPPAPPADGPPPVVSGPGRPAGPTDPKKKDAYDEDWHTPRPGDTFVTLSQEYFHDARYAQALQAYNKDRRKAGEEFYRIPPPWVLEDQYPNLVPKADKADRPPVEAKPTGDIKFEPAAPVGSSGRPAPPAAGGVTTAPSDEYRVLAKDGESIRDIAQKVLGSPNGWRKLWDLNPDVDPTQPIPAGTTLRVPRQ